MFEIVPPQASASHSDVDLFNGRVTSFTLNCERVFTRGTNFLQAEYLALAFVWLLNNLSLVRAI